MLYDNNAFSLYLDSTYTVTDWDALANSADVFFVRAAALPLVNNEINYDNMLATGIYEKEDPSYKTTLLQLRNRGKKVLAVVEYNHMYDAETSWNRSDQALFFKDIFRAAGNFTPDGIVVKLERVDYFQYGSGGKLQTDGNLVKGIEALFKTLYNEMHISLFLWTAPKIGHGTAASYNYQSGLDRFFYYANAGEASYTCGFSYIPAYWSVEKLNGRTFTNPRDLLAELRPLTSDESKILVIGERSGWGQTTGTGQKLHSFWGFNYGSYAPFLKGANGNLKIIEPFVWDCDKATLWEYMLWSDTQPPVDPGDDGDTGDGGDDGSGDNGSNDGGTVVVDLSEINAKLDAQSSKLDQILAEQAKIHKFAEEVVKALKETFGV